MWFLRTFSIPLPLKSKLFYNTEWPYSLCKFFLRQLMLIFLYYSPLEGLGRKGKVHWLKETFSHLCYYSDLQKANIVQVFKHPHTFFCIQDKPPQKSLCIHSCLWFLGHTTPEKISYWSIWNYISQHKCFNNWLNKMMLNLYGNSFITETALWFICDCVTD